MPVRMDSPTTHVIFDYCGTVIDLPRLIEEILKENALDYERRSKNANLTKLRESVSFDEICEEVYNTFELKIEGHPNYKDLDLVKKTLLKWISERYVPISSGAQKMIRHLHEHNIPMAIATNLDSRVFDVLMERTVGLNDKLISHYVCGGTDREVKVSKPAPDLYLVCAKRFTPPPESVESCLIFEHSIKGITSAAATGMKTVLVTNQTVRELGGIADKATRIIKSLDNFCPESVGLPPY